MALKGINHIVLKVRDPDASEGFYRLLGFEPTGTREDLGMRFFSAGGHHHHLALYPVGPEAPAPPSGGVGMAHFCVTVEEEGDLRILHDALATAGHRILGLTDHVVSRSFYARDPDGHTVEVTWDVPREQWAHLDNPFAEDRPYELP